jgi:uncharacterized surface protein with fasciclin (FAS1) repeats
MTTLKKTIIATNLDQVLSSSGPYTFFAPLDLAFAKMENDAVEKMLKPENSQALTDILHLHVVNGKISFNELVDGQKLKTLQGRELSVHVQDGTVSIDNAVIQNHDVKSSNGVIHCVDTVLN